MREPYLRDPDVTLYHGDALAVLRELPDESVHCIATSPPFYGLRDYGTGRWEGGDEGCDHKPPMGDAAGLQSSTLQGGKKTTAHHQDAYKDRCGKCGGTRIDQQIGLEATPDEWAARLVDVFREARRVLRKDGTLWVECGDSYSGGERGKYAGDGARPQTNAGSVGSYPARAVIPNVKAKDLLGTPWLLAFALRADGWWLRGCNIWAKPNAMPESAKDRCTTAHSYVFHLSKSARYFFDGDAISEPINEQWVEHWKRHGHRPITSNPDDPHRKQPNAATQAGVGFRVNGDGSITGRNPRSVWTIPDDDLPAVMEFLPVGETFVWKGRAFSVVAEAEEGVPISTWTIPTQGFPEAHFATWPEALARRIILAGCPEWVCSVCGKARERIVGGVKYEPRVVEPGVRFVDESHGDKTRKLDGKSKEWRAAAASKTTLGFTDCGHNAYIPGTVLDPFAGSGTTCYVARKLGRRSIGIDLSEPYLAMAARRLAQQSLLAEPA